MTFKPSVDLLYSELHELILDMIQHETDILEGDSEVSRLLQEARNFLEISEFYYKKAMRRML